ncbi:MAG: glycosyltransferase family 4 protein [Actinobacteria bacterium]|nr:glycosyltransferase family 4 protein [Actinomycetota bacterium]
MQADVLFDATPLDRDHAARGIGAAVRGMAEGLAGLPDEQRPAFLIAGDGENAPLTPERYSVRWPHFRVRRLPDPWPMATIERHVRGLRPSLFHSTQAQLLPTGMPSVVTLYDLIPAAYPKLFLAGAGRRAEASAYRRWMKRLPDARLLLCISQETAADAVRLAGADPARVRVVPLAAPPAPLPAGEVPDDPYILMSGGLEPHKNPWPVVSALAMLPEPLRLVMTGPWGGRRVRLLRDYAHRAGVLHRVDLLGHVPASRLAALREGAVAVVVPSIKEGFGLPVLEAMEAGVPVIASDTPALREVGVDGPRYEDPFDTAGWADAIAEAWQEPEVRKAASIGGPSRAKQFSWDRTTELVTQAYDEVLAA